MELNISPVFTVNTASTFGFAVSLFIGYSRSRERCLFVFTCSAAVFVAANVYLESLLIGWFDEMPLFRQGVFKLQEIYPDLITTWPEVASWSSVMLCGLTSWLVLIATICLEPKSNHIRGAQLFDKSRMLRELSKKGKPKKCINIGQFFIPTDLETRALSIVGEPGSGKTQLLLQILKSLKGRGNRFVCLDVAGDIYKKIGETNDVVLSAVHEEGVDYSPFSEIRSRSDCDFIASCFIPEGNGEAKTWNGYARQALTAILDRCIETGKTTNGELIQYAAFAGREVLCELVKGTPAQRLFEGKNEKKLDDVLGIVSQYIKPLTYFNPLSGRESFSLRSWVEDESKISNLWIIFDDVSAEATASLRASWISVLIRQALSLQSNSNRRLYCILDELAANGCIDPLRHAISRGRKYGLGIIYALQNLAQLNAVYGRDVATSILASTGHNIVLRVPDAETSEFLSKGIGDAETEKEQTSISKPNNTSSVQKIREIKRLVLPSEISKLQDLHGYLKIAGVGWAKLVIPVTKIPNIKTLSTKNDTAIAVKAKESNSHAESSALSLDDV